MLKNLKYLIFPKFFSADFGTSAVIVVAWRVEDLGSIPVVAKFNYYFLKRFGTKNVKYRCVFEVKVTIKSLDGEKCYLKYFFVFVLNQQPKYLIIV